MSTVDGLSAPGGPPVAQPADLKLEAVIPVADADRSKAFYVGLGWRLDADFAEHEKRTGEADPDWPDWYAAYMVSEQSGQDAPA